VSNGGHSHGYGSGGEHTHGGGGGSSGVGIGLAILMGIFVIGGAVAFITDAVSKHAALSHDSVLTQQDSAIRSARLGISCREIVENANGSQSVGPQCGSGIKSAALAIQLTGLPAGVKLTNSSTRGTYGASCTVIAGGDQVAGSTSMVTGRSFQEVPSSSSGMWLPSDTCEIQILEPSQAVEIDITRQSISDSNTSNSFLIRKFTATLDPGWFTTDGAVYGSQG
jgi:hypothetical protein